MVAVEPLVLDGHHRVLQVLGDLVHGHIDPVGGLPHQGQDGLSVIVQHCGPVALGRYIHPVQVRRRGQGISQKAAKQDGKDAHTPQQALSQAA